MENPPIPEPVKQTESTKLNDIYQFCARHKASFFIAFLWACREWTTVKGWYGLTSFFLTGKTTQ